MQSYTAYISMDNFAYEPVCCIAAFSDLAHSSIARFFFIDVELCADLRVQVEVEHISTVGIGYAK